MPAPRPAQPSASKAQRLELLPAVVFNEAYVENGLAVLIAPPVNWLAGATPAAGAAARRANR